MCVACTHPPQRPPLVARLTSYTFQVTREELEDWPDPAMAVGELQAKLHAEMERLLRLAPEPPEGKLWVPEVQRMDDVGFAADEVNFRVVCKLRDGF